MHPESKKVWLVGVDMGYGHQRAAVPLLAMAKEGRVITANNYEGIPDEDRRVWVASERFYNFVSRLKGKSFLGDLIFDTFDILQSIAPFYPKKDESSPSMQLRQIYRSIRKGWGRHLIEKFMADPAPIVTTFFAVAHMADYWNYPAPIYAVVTDSDISRVWAPLEPKESRIIYFASSARSADRLTRYGVPAERIIQTGFPLPEELLGPRDKDAKEALRRRVRRLDPEGNYRRLAAGFVRQHAGAIEGAGRKKDVPEVVFAVGGAGAQMDVMRRALPGLAKFLRQKKLTLHLVAGVSDAAADRFQKILMKAGLQKELGGSVRIHVWTSKEEYFPQFMHLLKRADLLWTKPSELSFYAALGLPILIAPPVGSQEKKNKEWLQSIGSGIEMPDPRASGEWFPDFMREGRFAEAALQGFAKMERHGAAHIRGYLTLGKN